MMEKPHSIFSKVILGLFLLFGATSIAATVKTIDNSNASLCEGMRQVDKDQLVNYVKSNAAEKLFASYFEFFRNGGKGILFQYSDSEIEQENKPVILVQSWPASINTDTNSMFLRDKRTLQELTDQTSKGIPILLMPVGQYQATASYSKLYLTLKKCALIPSQAPRIIAITSKADFYTIKHELKHYSDAQDGVFGDIKNKFGELNQKKLITEEQENILVSFIMEQRAYTTEMSSIKSSSQEIEFLNSFEDSPVIKNGVRVGWETTKYTVTESNRDEYIQKQIHEKTFLFQTYSSWTNKVLDQVKENLEAYERIKLYLKEYCLNSTEFSLEVQLSEHFK